MSFMEQASSGTSPGPRSGETLSAELAETASLLGSDPKLAEERARKILREIPGQQHALFLLVCACRLQGDAPRAEAALKQMAAGQPSAASVQFELGQLAGSAGDAKTAADALSRAVELEPSHPAAWRALGNQLVQSGKSSAAARPYASHIRASTKELKLLEDVLAAGEDQFAAAENMLHELLKIQPTDIFTMYALAQIAMHQKRYEEAELLLARILELVPGFTDARQKYVESLGQEMKWAESNAQLEILLREQPENTRYRLLKAQNLRLLADYKAAKKAYEELIEEDGEEAIFWTGYAHTLRELGQTDGCIDAYRRSVALQPTLGRAWWGLASLKTFRFTASEIEAMKAQLQCGVDEEDRIDLHFALGKALEDEGNYAESFEQYRMGNALLWRRARSNPGALDEYVARCKRLFTREFFEARKGYGCPAPDPIFIVGLPRAGSTLLEQILASHPSVEGTMELPDVVHMANQLDRGSAGSAVSPYPDILGTLSEAELSSLGEEYLRRTRHHRKLGRPFFIDKTPHNLEHIGLIHLMLPNAKIIDARRHPLGCGFSVYKQHFTIGMNFTYDLSDIGHYYRRYVELMAHFDSVLPGRVHRVLYEDLVRNPEDEIRRLLHYCGLPFERACLRFYETERNVRTMSSEQVRQPIYSDAIEHWRKFEPWLGPLKKALGPVLDAYPAVPSLV